VLVIKQPEVEKMLRINPELHERLRERVKYLATLTEAESDARKRAEGIDQRIRLADAVNEAEFQAQAGRAAPPAEKFQLVRQQDATESAAACLAMVTRHYGKNFSVGQVREITNLSTANPTPNNIITAAEKLGFNSKAYALKYEQLLRLMLPAVIGWEDYHYAVLFRITPTEVHIADPDAGIRRLSREEFVKSWSAAEVPGVQTAAGHGVYIAFYPTQTFLRLHEPTRPFRHFLNYILPYKFYFGEAMLAALTINLLGLASPLFVQNIVDTVIVHKDVGLLNVMLVGMMLVAMLSTLATAAQTLLLAFVTARIDLKLVAEFYRHVLSLPMSFFMTRNKGEILSRFAENQKIRHIMAGQTITAILNLMMIVIYLFMMLAYSARLTLIFLVFVPIYIGIIVYFTPRFRDISNRIFHSGAHAQSQLIEALNGIEALKATANEYMARARWEDSFVDNVNLGYNQAKLNLASSTLYTLATLSASISILWVGANLVMAGTMTIGELMGFNMLMGLVTGPIMGMVQLWQSVQEVRIAVERVSDVLNVAPEEAPIVGPENARTPLNAVQGRIEFRNVNFSYVANNERSLVMRDFSLVIEPGMRVAFVGPSGCGKSTIAKMILGFNLPLAGACMIDGHDITKLDLGALRRNIGVVLQDSFLFAGTVAQNIALGDPDPDMQRVVEAAKLAGAHEFVLNYPLGYHTPIGEKGMGISGGQRQRICIARALYHRPKIMIFDEATSALDEESQQRIQENMRHVVAGRTSITIAHRLTTIIDCDMICYINQGRVLESGTHQQLIDPAYLKAHGFAGRYYELAQPQFNLPRLVIA
jgi:ATP-binding cassette subfamily B protein